MSAKRVAGEAVVVSVSRLALLASLRRKTLLLACSSTRRVPMACHSLLVLWRAGGAGVWALTGPVTPSTVMTTPSRRGSDRSRACTGGPPKVNTAGPAAHVAAGARWSWQASCRMDEHGE